MLYVPMSLGVVVLFRVLRFPDLTVDGSFTLGGAVAAIAIARGHSLWSLPLAVVAGGVAGMATAILHITLRVNRLIAGIVVLTALYTLTLRLMGSANIQLINTMSLFDYKVSGTGTVVALLTAIAAGSLLILYLVFQTVGGLWLRAIGDNVRMVANYGRAAAAYVVIGLAIGNALVALTGALLASYQGFADINMGAGSLVLGLAYVFIGAAVVRSDGIVAMLISGCAGAALFLIAIQFALRAGLNPVDLKLATAVVVAICLSLFRRRDAASVVFEREL